MLALPVSFVSQAALLGGLPSEAGLLVLVLSQALASVDDRGLRGTVHHRGRLAAVPRPADAHRGSRRRPSCSRPGSSARDPAGAGRTAPGPLAGRGALAAAPRAAGGRLPRGRRPRPAARLGAAGDRADPRRGLVRAAALHVLRDARRPAARARPGVAGHAHPRHPRGAAAAGRRGPRRLGRARTSGGPGPRRRTPPGTTPTRWSTASGPWPCARWSGACWTTPPGRPPTSSPSPSGTLHPDRGQHVDEGARLFDLVLYGDRVATAGQARSVLALDDELAGTP